MKKIYKCGGCQSEVNDSQKFCNDCGCELGVHDETKPNINTAKFACAIIDSMPGAPLKEVQAVEFFMTKEEADAFRKENKGYTLYTIKDYKAAVASLEQDRKQYLKNG